jgi:hypothetical protein
MTIHRLMYWLFLAVGMILFATVGFLLADPFLKAVDGWFEGPAPISPLWTRMGLTTAGLLVGILVANSRLPNPGAGGAPFRGGGA